MDLNQLIQKIYDRKKKLKQIQIVLLCLNYVKEHPEHLNRIGIGWIDYSHFIFNCRIFAIFVNRIPNTINSYFRNHGFRCKRMTSELREKYQDVVSFDTLYCYSGWVIHYRDGFTQSTTEKESLSIQYFNKSKVLRAIKTANKNDDGNYDQEKNPNSKLDFNKCQKDKPVNLIKKINTEANNKKGFDLLKNHSQEEIDFNEYQNDDECDDVDIYFDISGC